MARVQCHRSCVALIAQSLLTNDAIIKMSKAGLSDDIIVSTVGSQPVKFSTSADDLIALNGIDRWLGGVHLHGTDVIRGTF